MITVMEKYPDQNLVSLSICPTQFSQVLAEDRTWHSAVTAQRIISWITEFSIEGPLKILRQISNNSLLKKAPCLPGAVAVQLVRTFECAAVHFDRDTQHFWGTLASVHKYWRYILEDSNFEAAAQCSLRKFSKLDFILNQRNHILY